MIKKQTQSFTFKTAADNKYLLSRSIPQIMLLHPVLHYLIELEEQGTKLDEWINTITPGNIEIENYPKLSKGELLYYLNFYFLLKKNNYFNEIKSIDKMNQRCDAGSVDYLIANSNQIIFEVTDACNLNCTYCAYSDLYSGHDLRTNKKLDIDTAKKLFDDVLTRIESPMNFRTHKRIAVSFYGGEPLLNMPFIKEMVEYVKTKKISYNQFCFSMTTNAVLLDKHLDFLAENDFYLLISLDGDEHNNSHRILHDGKPAYTATYNNILKLREKYPDYFKKSVSFNAVLHNKNSKEEIEKFFLDRFDKPVSVSQVSSNGLREERKEKFSEIFKQKPTEKIYNNLTRADINSVLDAYSGYSFFNINDLLLDKEKSIIIQTNTCLPFKNRIFLTVNGKILPCEKIKQSYYLGNADEKGVHLDAKSLTDKYNYFHQKIGKLCAQCFNSTQCKQCIFYLDLDSDNPHCENFLNFKGFKNKISDTLSALENTPELYSFLMQDKKIAALSKNQGQNAAKHDENAAPSFWLFLHPFVHVSIKKDHAVLLNTLTGQMSEYKQDTEILKILKELASEQNLLVTEIKGTQIDKKITDFVSELKKNYFGDIVDTRFSSGKPIQLKPLLKLNYDTDASLNVFKKQTKKLKGDEIPEYLESLSLYINNQCDLNCSMCGKSFQQFSCCKKDSSIEEELNIIEIESLLDTVQRSRLTHVNILGGNIFKYKNLRQLVERLNNEPSSKEYFIHYRNLEEKKDFFDSIKTGNSKLNIIIDLHFFNKETFAEKKGLLGKYPLNNQFHFIVENESNLLLAETVIEQFQITDYALHPYFTGQNLPFFKSNVYLNRESIIESSLSMKDIFIRSSLNLLDFRHLVIMSNKEIYSNVNNPKIGRLGENPIFNIVEKELNKGKSWGKVRKNVQPCKSCVFCDLCSPISNYEYAVGRYNLCNIKNS